MQAIIHPRDDVAKTPEYLEVFDSGVDRTEILDCLTEKTSGIAPRASFRYINFSTDDSLGQLQFQLVMKITDEHRSLVNIKNLLEGRPGRVYSRANGVASVSATFRQGAPIDPWDTWSVEFRLLAAEQIGIVRAVTGLAAGAGASFDQLVGGVKDIGTPARPESEFRMKGCMWCPSANAAHDLARDLRKLPFGIHSEAIRPARVLGIRATG